jgi:TonB family protein
MKALWLIIALAPSPAADARGPDCARLDPELIYCPAPEAPRITELREGRVVLELSIDPDGSVRSSKVVTSSGHPAWPGAAQAAVAKWRYMVAPKPRTREVPFDFQYGGP